MIFKNINKTLLILLIISICINIYLFRKTIQYRPTNNSVVTINDGSVPNNIENITQLNTQVVATRRIIAAASTTTTNTIVGKQPTGNTQKPVTIVQNNEQDNVLDDDMNVNLPDAELKITLEPIKIYQDADNKIYVSPNIKGEAKLAYLAYDLNVKIKPEIIYNKNWLDLRIGAFGFIDGINPLDLKSNFLIEKDFELPFDLRVPIFDNKICLGVNFNTLALLKRMPIYSNMSFDLGVGYNFSGKPTLPILFGVSFKI